MDVFQPLHADYHSCFEDLLVSTANYLHKNYELMYCEAWNFAYQGWSINNPDIFGKRVSEGKNQAHVNLDKFHGIHLAHEKNVIHPSDAFALIKDQLMKKEMPVIVYLDDYFFPESNDYAKEHHLNSYLLFGLGKEDDSYLCFTPMLAEKVKTFSSAVLTCAYKYCVTIHNREQPAVDVSKLYKVSALNMLQGEGKGSRFDEMRNFGKDMGMTLDIAFEGTIDEQGNNQIQLLNRLKYLTRRRRQYAVFLHYFSRTYHQNFSAIAAQFETAADQWNLVMNVLLKIFIMGKCIPYRQQLTDKIASIADTEEALAFQLINRYK